MFQFRQALVRLRAGDTAREIARSGVLGCDKLTELLKMAQAHGWLDIGAELPDDAAIAAAMGPRKRATSTVSSVEPLRAVVQRWFDAGVQGRAIYAALQREHGFTGSYSAIVRMLRGLRAAQPPEVTVRLAFALGRGGASGLRRRSETTPWQWCHHLRQSKPHGAMILDGPAKP